VIEHSQSETASYHLIPTLPQTSQRMSASLTDQDDNPTISVSRRRINVRIDSERVTEIQQALLKRGLYQGDPTGIYDEETINAMIRFQASQKIPATGYPTAHSLNRLGLVR
jgi:peptidoglycan hydrolase-like protein with peptidoglycan-binding domain